MIKNNIYELSNDLVKLGYLSDNTGVYIPYTHKNDIYHDCRDIYLKISRGNTEKEKLIYTIVKLEEGLFYPIDYFSSPELLNILDKKLKQNLAFKGKLCNLNSGNGIYKNFVDTFFNNINNSECLDILKKEDYDFKKIRTNNNLMVTGQKNSHHNFMDMRDLVKLTTGEEPKYSYPQKGYDMFLCPFHDDNKASARVHEHVFCCFKNKEWQLDQTAYLKLFYNLDTSQEVESKFHELLKQ